MYIQSQIGKKVKAAFHFLYSKLAMMVFSLRRGFVLTHLIPKSKKQKILGLRFPKQSKNFHGFKALDSKAVKNLKVLIVN